MSIFRSVLLVAGIGATLAAAQGKVTQCPISNVCYALSIPPSTASSGTGDIYMQISAPTSYQWVALGQGTQMAGANMFIIYSSASGNNVTVSPRRASGEVMPRYVSDTQLTVLQGSGISNGQMVANIKCGNCASWSGGSMNLQSGNSNWIFSYRTGNALSTDSQSQSLVQHDNYGFITWDVTQARASSAANPFISADGTTSATNSSSNGNANSGSSSTGGGSSNTGMYITVHGSLSTVAFVALYPIGALVIRFASFKGTIWAHAGIQALAYMVQIAGAGIGIWLAITLSKLDSYHAIIGLILLGIIFFQPFLGWFHHKVYQRTKARGVHSHAHILIGRAAILLGIINGGFGLQLAGAERSEYIAYGVCAGVVGAAYIAAFMYGEVRRSKVQHNGSPHSSIGESKNNAA